MKLHRLKDPVLINRGPLTGHYSTYATKHGFPVAMPDDQTTYNGSEAIEIPEGIVVIDWREDALYFVGLAGELVPLMVRVVPAPAGVFEAARYNEMHETLKGVLGHADPLDSAGRELFENAERLLAQGELVG